MYDNLEILNTYFGIIGFFLTLATFFLSLRIKKRVEQEYERADYKEYIDKYLGRLEAIRDKLEYRDELEIETIKVMTNDLSTEVLTKYSFLPFKLRRKLKKLPDINFESLDDGKQYLDFRNKVTELINLLEKENKNGIK